MLDAVRRVRMPPWPATVSWVLAVGCALAAVVRLFGLDRGSLLVQLIAFTPYLAVGSILAAIVAGLSRRWWALGVAGIAAAVLVGCVVPRAVSSDPAAAGGTTLTIMSANLRFGGADAQSIVDVVRTARVDVLALQEYTPEAELRLLDVGLADILPYRESHPDDGPFGSAIFARVPLTDGGVRTATQGTYDQAHATIRVPGTEPIVIESVHPVPPTDPEQTVEWRDGLRTQARADAPGPRRILVGDFNASLDHFEFRALLGTGYRDAASEVGAGLTATWPYYGPRSPLTPRITLDHVLVPAGVGVRSFSAVVIPRTDHRAIVATLTV